MCVCVHLFTLEDRKKTTYRFFDSILIIAHNECRKVIELFFVYIVYVLFMPFL